MKQKDPTVEQIFNVLWKLLLLVVVSIISIATAVGLAVRIFAILSGAG